MIPYILYAALILVACFIFYKLLLQNETFFHLNRFVLLSCMALAFILPLIRVPPQLSFRVAQAPADISIVPAAVQPGYIIRPQAENTNTDTVSATTVQPSINFDHVIRWMVYLYWFGVAVFTCNFLFQASLLLYRAYASPVIKDGKFRIVEITGDKAPCSFGNNIFINPANYDWQTYNQVLLHEKIHIEEKHTIDLLLAEIMLIFQWFNPFAWAWRKELENNLEFFTDQKLLQQPEIEKETYQLSLLKVAAPHFPLSLTTNYNQSLLKKRILMMNTKRSNLHTAWKYFFLLPLMVVFVCLFNEPVAKAQQNNAQAKTKAKSNSHQQHNGGIKTSGNWFATIKEDKMNIQFKNAGDEENSYNGTTFSMSEFKDLPRDKPGVFTLAREAGSIEFKGKFDGDKGMGEYKFTPDKNYSSDMYKEGINLATDEDLMVFYFVNIKRGYVKMLKQQGYTNLDKDKLIPLAALDINESYITSIKQAGFTHISLDNLIPFKSLNVDKAYIDEIRKSGYKDVTPDKIITFKAQGIDGKYIADFHSAAKTNVAEKDDDENEETAVNANNNSNSSQNKNKNAKVNGNRHSGKNGHRDEDDIIAFKALNIDPEFINSFKEVGYNNLSNSNLISMKAVGVTPGFVKSLQEAGYTNIKADDLIALKSQDVTPSLIKQYKDLGFDNVSLDDIVGAKATGTSPSFIIAMREKGHTMKSLDKYIALKSVLGE